MNCLCKEPASASSGSDRKSRSMSDCDQVRGSVALADAQERLSNASPVKSKVRRSKGSSTSSDDVDIRRISTEAERKLSDAIDRLCREQYKSEARFRQILLVGQEGERLVGHDPTEGSAKDVILRSVDAYGLSRMGEDGRKSRYVPHIRELVCDALESLMDAHSRSGAFTGLAPPASFAPIDAVNQDSLAERSLLHRNIYRTASPAVPPPSAIGVFGQPIAADEIKTGSAADDSLGNLTVTTAPIPASASNVSVCQSTDHDTSSAPSLCSNVSPCLSPTASADFMPSIPEAMSSASLTLVKELLRQLRQVAFVTISTELAALASSFLKEPCIEAVLRLMDGSECGLACQPEVFNVAELYSAGINSNSTPDSRLQALRSLDGLDAHDLRRLHMAIVSGFLNDAFLSRILAPDFRPSVHECISLSETLHMHSTCHVAVTQELQRLNVGNVVTQDKLVPRPPIQSSASEDEVKRARTSRAMSLFHGHAVRDVEWIYEPLSFRMIDVSAPLAAQYITREARQWHDRHSIPKWLHMFADVSSIVFVVDLCDYSRRMKFDPEVNALNESLYMYTRLARMRIFRNTPFVVIFTNKEKFAKLLESQPLSVWDPCFDTRSGNLTSRSVAQSSSEELSSSPLPSRHIASSLVVDAIHYIADCFDASKHYEKRPLSMCLLKSDGQCDLLPLNTGAVPIANTAFVKPNDSPLKPSEMVLPNVSPLSPRQVITASISSLSLPGVSLKPILPLSSTIFRLISAAVTSKYFRQSVIELQGVRERSDSS